MDFWNGRDFGNNFGDNGGYNRSGQSFQGDATGSCGNSESEMREKVNKYSGKSEDELMAELTNKAAELRAAGKLNVAELEDFYMKASMFLNKDQLRRMRALIDMLK